MLDHRATDPAPVRRTQVQVNGQPFRVIEQGQGPAVLFCHGFPDTIASVKMVGNRAHAEVAIVQAALGGNVIAEAASFGINSAMASTCM